MNQLETLAREACRTALQGVLGRKSIGKEGTIYNAASCDMTAGSEEECTMSAPEGRKPKRKLRHVRKYLAKVNESQLNLNLNHDRESLPRTPCHVVNACNVRMNSFKCVSFLLSSHFLKDFSDSKWTIAIMWEGKAQPWITKVPTLPGCIAFTWNKNICSPCLIITYISSVTISIGRIELE